MVANPDEVAKKFETVNKLHELGWRTHAECDEALRQYKLFLNECNRDHLVEFEQWTYAQTGHVLYFLLLYRKRSIGRSVEYCPDASYHLTWSGIC